MPVLDLVDDTYVDVPPAALAASVHDPCRWRTWWPDLLLEVTRDRGPKGMQWAARPAPGAPTSRRPGGPPGVLWTGTTEIWLEPWRERGTVLHHYQRLDPLRPDRLAAPVLARLRERRAREWKHHVHRLKDEAEGQELAPARRSSTG